RARDGCALLLEGYRDGLKAGGHRYVLDEEHPALREIALGELRDPADFWRKLRGMPKVQHAPSPVAQSPLQTHESLFMRKQPRRDIEEPQPDDLLQADAEQIELDTFLDAIGAEGSVKVKLYRLTPTGKQVFIQEGPPSIFSE